VTRVLAFLTAAAMVAGAFVLRGAAGTGDAGAEEGTGPSALAIVCDDQLADACQALSAAGHDVTSEAAGPTADRLGETHDPDDVPDVWITLAPWPAMVDDARSRAGLPPLFAPVAAPIAASPLVIVLWEDRADVLGSSCPGGEVDIRCVTDAAGRAWNELGGEAGWGTVKPGIDHPGNTSTGLAALAVATVGRLGTQDFGTTRLEAGTYLDWLTRFATAVQDFDPPAGSPLAAMLQAGSATYDLAMTTEAAALRATGGPAHRRDQLRLVYPEPITTVDVVVANDGTTDVGAVEDVAEGALSDAMWHTGTRSPERSAELRLARRAGETLPGPGALVALRSTFTDTVRR
jgi:hypothetical protein